MTCRAQHLLSRLCSSLVLVLFWAGPAVAAGTLHGPVRIASAILGYDLQYWVYLPEGAALPLPELYFTDGHAFLAAGHAVEVLDAEIAAGKVAPLAAVFVDSRDPDHPDRNRRNEQFMCKVDYGKFFVGELLPEIAQRWSGAGAGTRRALAGVSFGAINAACFGVMLPGVFTVLILHSPGSDRHLEAVQELYEQKPRQAAAFFLTHGGRNDNASAARRFVQTLRRKGYAVRYEVNHGRHDWDNWRRLVDDDLRVVTGLAAGDRLELP